MLEAARPPVLSDTTGPLVEGALLAALLVLFGAVSFYTGFGWLQPIPVIFAFQRHGGRIAGFVVFVGGSLLALWLGPFASLATAGFAAALGLVAGWSWRRRLGPGTTVALMATALLAVTGLGVGATVVLWHQNLWTQVWLHFIDLLHAHAAALARLGLTPDAARRAVWGALPLIIVLAAVLECGGVYVLASAVLRRLGVPLPAPPPVGEWRAPRWLSLPFAVVWLTAVAARHTGRTATTAVAWNVLTALALLYSGVAVAAGFGWSRARGLSRRRSAAAALLGGALLGATAPSGLILIGLVASHWPRGPTAHSR